MNKSTLCLAALLIASPAFSGEPRIHTTRDSGSYESTLRQAGIPLAGGMAWAPPYSGTAAIRVTKPVVSILAATTPPAKAN